MFHDGVALCLKRAVLEVCKAGKRQVKCVQNVWKRTCAGVAMQVAEAGLLLNLLCS